MRCFFYQTRAIAICVGLSFAAAYFGSQSAQGQTATAEPDSPPAAAQAAVEPGEAAAAEKPESSETSEALSEPQQAALKQVTFDIKYLSSDEMAGRQPGTPGIKLAEDYIVAEYKKAGLKPLENGTYLQEFEVGKSRTVDPEKTSLVLKGPNDSELKLKDGEDYRQLTGRDDFELDSELVFVGYGISADEHNYLEYDGVDVKDKIVVLIRREPQAEDSDSVFNGDKTSRHSYARSKITAARRAGAAGILMVNDGLTATDAERDALVTSDQFGSTSLPFAQVKRSVMDEILEQSPLTSPTGMKLKSLQEVEDLIDSNLEPLSQVIPGWTASFNAGFDENAILTSNIIGIIEGEGPNADETIVIGAHYDHLGDGAYGSRAGGRREIHNGADDNATGTAAVIELARRFNRRSEKPGRRLVFICFTAEEMGLLGAYHYVQDPTYPLEKTAAMINFDMIGWLRDDELTLYGWNSSPQLAPVFDAANEGIGLELNKPTSGFGGSDHLPFNEQRIPNTFIHTGINAVYHTPEDDFEAINCEGALRVIDYSENVVAGLASLETKPKFGTPKRFRLGVMLDEEDDVVTIAGVTSNSVAEKSGLKVGDVILEVDGKKLTKRREMTRIIRRDRGKTIQMKLKRDDAEILLNVELNDEEDEG